MLLKLAGKPSHAKGMNRRVTRPDVAERAKCIFGNRVLPNLVLLERREEAIGNSIDNLLPPDTVAT